MSRTRAFLSALVLVSGISLAAPAGAQVMPSQGLDIPWFSSTSERAARDACRRNLPECRAGVRAQMAVEESITVILPWASLGVAFLGLLFYMRAKEKKRERQKRLARMNHSPGAYKKLDKDKNERKGRDDEDEEADRLAF